LIAQKKKTETDNQAEEADPPKNYEDDPTVEQGNRNNAEELADPKKENSKVDSNKDIQTDTYEDDSSGPGFLTYFLVLSTIFIAGYIAYYNKSKILGMLVEGRPKRRYQRLSNN